MSLQSLRDSRLNVHLLYTDSNMLELFVYDTLKEQCEANTESIFNVNTVGEFNTVLDMVNTMPFLARKWFVVLPYKKFASHVKKYLSVFSSDTAVFLIKVNNYKEYKACKDTLERYNVNELYLTYLPLKDIYWLLDGSGLSQSLVDFVYKSYSREPDKVLTLSREIKNGLNVENRKDIINLCGVGGTTIQAFALSLLTTNINTERGAKSSLKKKLTEGIDLAREYGVSTFRNYLSSAFHDMIDIKEMYLNGDIYDQIKGIPEKFDEKKLSRYRIYYKSILSIEIEKIVEMYIRIQNSGTWRKEVDMVEFLYSLYADKLERVEAG